MQTRLKLDLWKQSGSTAVLQFAFLFMLFFPFSTLAITEGLVDPEARFTNMIEIEYPPATYLPYRERRSDWSVLFGFRYDNLMPNGFKSAIDSAAYGDLFGSSPINLFAVRSGGKINLSGASIAGELSYGNGQVSDTRSGQVSTLELSALGAHVGLWLDTLLPEPYIVPYVQADVLQYDYRETAGIRHDSGTASLVYGWTAGLLLQLNWLDRESSMRSLVETNMNNAYLDVFANQSQQKEGVQLATDLTWGVGLQLEF